MSNNNHKTELTTLVNELMTDIDSKPLHPRNKLLVYSRYVLSKLSWHFTIATLSKTWVIENIDPVVNQYIRKWLEIPISGTLSTVFLTCNKFGQSIYPPSVKFIQCQTVLRKALKLSPNQSINELWKSTNTHTNIQYDFYNSTKEVLKDFRSEHEDKLKNQLTCQVSFFSNVTKFSLSHLNKVWSTAQMGIVFKFRMLLLSRPRILTARRRWMSVLSRSIYVEAQFNPELSCQYLANCERFCPPR